MYPESPTPPLSITPTTQSWTRDSTLDDDAQHQTQSDAPGSSTVFEKKWIVTEVGDSGTPFFLICVARLLRSRLSRSGESCVSFSFSVIERPTTYAILALVFFSRMSSRMGLSRRTASFSTPTSMTVRRRREEEVRIVLTVVTPLCELSRRRRRHDPSLTFFSSPASPRSLPYTRVGGRVSVSRSAGCRLQHG